jgi:hypothetical protein
MQSLLTPITIGQLLDEFEKKGRISSEQKGSMKYYYYNS